MFSSDTVQLGTGPTISPKEEPMSEGAEEALKDYKFSYADPGLFLEIYVPTSYEPQVRETLLKGMDLDIVKEYLKNAKNQDDIRDLLRENDKLKAYTDATVDDIKENPLGGFSIYQVDGAFRGEGGIEAEKVSIVRLLFLP